MKTLTFKDRQPLIDAITIIVDDKLQYDANSNNTFTIFENIKVTLNSNSCTVNYNNSSLTEYKDVEKLLNYILVQTTNNKSLLHLRSQGSYFDELNFKDQNHIRRLAFYPFFEETPEAIYKKLVFGDMKPFELKEQYEISSKFVQMLREQNRKSIMHSIIDEVASTNQQYLAA